MTYTDFESILVLGNNGKQNPNESCTNKYKKRVACSYDYKLFILYVLMINLISFLNHIDAKMLFTTLFAV